MRTLKKTLCLVLCLAMMVGLCAFGASASTFTDDADIQNKEAVDLLQGIGVLEGKPDGDGFKLDLVSTLTRGEACTIIYRLLGHGTKAYTKNTVFTDVTAAHWASGYIAFCYEAGIVAGVGHDLFKPNDPLTAGAWAKMLLCALGYDAEAEGLTGTSWKFNTTKLVARTKLAEGLEGGFDATAEMNRDNAALLSFNALTVPIVEYQGGLNVSTPDGTTVSRDNTRVATNDYLADNFGLKVETPNWAIAGEKDETKHGFATDGSAYVKGVITANGFNAENGAVTKIGNTNMKIETGEELLGHYVIAYIDEDGAVVSLTDIGSVKKVDEDLTKAADIKAKFGTSTKYNADGVTRFSGGNINTSKTAYTISEDVAVPAGSYVYDDAGKLVAELLDNYTIVTLEKVKAIGTTAGAENIEFVGGTKLNNNEEQDVVREYEGIAKDDIVIAEKVGAITYLTKAEPIEGTISAVDKDGVITLNGTAYAASAATNQGAVTAVAVADLKSGAVKLKDTTFDVYLYDDEYIAVVVKKAEETFGPVYYWVGTSDKTSLKNDALVYERFANVVDNEGNKASFLVDSKSASADLTSFAANVGKIYTFEADPTTGINTATVFTQFPATGTAKILPDTATGAANPATKKITLTTKGATYVNDASTFIYVDPKGDGTVKSVTVKTGIGAYGAAGAAALYTVDKDGNAVLKTAFIGAAFAAPTADPAAVYYVAPGTVKDSTSADGYVFTVYDVVKGEKTEITVAKDFTGKAGFYKFTAKDGITKLGDYAIRNDAVDPDYIDANYLQSKTYDGKYETNIRISGSGELAAADVVVVDVRSAATVKADAVGALNSIDAIAAAKKTGTVTLDARLIDNGASKSVAIIFVTAYTAA